MWVNDAGGEMNLKWERRVHHIISEYYCLIDPTNPGPPLAEIWRHEGYSPIGGNGPTHRYVGQFLLWQTSYQPDLGEIQKEVITLIKQKCQELLDAIP
jgi:hypothetical protein